MNKPRAFLIALAPVVVAGGLFLAVDRPASEADAIKKFLDGHWVDPIAPQGNPPAHFTPLEASLDPAACGECHPSQHQQWRGSLHSRAMGSGIRWQLPLLGAAEANRCLRCHAPLAEQKALVARDLRWPNAPVAAPPDYVPPHLAEEGVVCAACHLRGHQRFGPPPRAPFEAPAHDGFEQTAAFRDSRFCAFCHQFPEDGPRLAGKLHEDTYAQWQASGYSARGESCQSCHMPEGRHLWRGIHDPEMVRRALAVELVVVPNGAGAEVEAILRNVGAGHHFPTYLVPKVEVAIRLVDPQGLRREVARTVIGWRADVGLSREEFDTRIPAGGSRALRRAIALPAEPGWRIELSVAVAPREHYERMYRDVLRQAARLDEGAVTQLREALEEAEGTRYEALRVSEPLPAVQPAAASNTHPQPTPKAQDTGEPRA